MDRDAREPARSIGIDKTLPAMDASDDISIFQLITRLCQSQCHDYNQKRLHGAPLGEDAVRRMRNAAFEVLLQKGPSESANRTESAEDDPLREFHYHQFDMRLRAQTAFDRDRCVELEDCMDELLHESAFFQSDSGQSVLMFLLLLKNSVASDIETSVMVSSSTILILLSSGKLIL